MNTARQPEGVHAVAHGAEDPLSTARPPEKVHPVTHDAEMRP